MASRLIVLAGPDEGHVFTLGTEPILFGRSRATEGHLTDPHTSRVHCQVALEGSQYILTDFDSGSGTFANGKEINRHALQPGDLVRIGSTHLQYVTDSASAIITPGTPPAATQGDWAKKLIGQTLSHYRISAPLAKGKTGYLFHAQDARNETAVALKVLHPDFSQDEKKVQHFIDRKSVV